MTQSVAPLCYHGSRPISVAVGNVRPAFAAALVLLQPFVARRVRKRAAPDLVPAVTVAMMNGAFQIRWFCRCCPCCQEQHSQRKNPAHELASRRFCCERGLSFIGLLYSAVLQAPA